MKKLLYILLIFLAVSMGLNAFTLRESVQETLSRKGVKQEIIDETVEFLLNSRKEIGITAEKQTINELIKNSEKLLSKDRKNIMIKTYLASLYMIEEGKNPVKSKKLIEEVKKDFSEFEKLYIDIIYYSYAGNKAKMNETFDTLKTKYKETPAVYEFVEIKLMEREMQEELKKIITKEKNPGSEKFFEEFLKKTEIQMKKAENVIKFFHTEERKREFGIVDEMLLELELPLQMFKINKLILNGKSFTTKNAEEISGNGVSQKNLQLIADIYLKNIANNKKITLDSVRYNYIAGALVTAMVQTLTQDIENEKLRNDFNEKIENSKLYKILEEID